MQYSIVIISFNGREYIADCLKSVQESLAGELYEIIVVDNGSSDGTLEIVKSDFPAVTVIENSGNLGFAVAVNQGIERSRGEYIFILNQDTRVQSRAIVKLAERMERDSTIGSIGPKLVGFDGKPQSSCRAFPHYRHLLFEYTGLAYMFPHSRLFGSWRMGWFDHNDEREVDQPMGAALLVRRGIIEKIGPFDEQFRIFFNDVDFCRRIKETGYKNWFYPEAIIEHYGGGSIRKNRPAMILESHRAMRLYLKKYSRTFTEKGLLLIWTPLLLIGGHIRAAVAALRK